MQQSSLKDYFKTTKKRLRESSEHTSVSAGPRKSITEQKEFYSPKKTDEKNIFTSPIKLSEIKSPKTSSSQQAVAKRLYCTLSKSPATPTKGNNDGPSGSGSRGEKDADAAEKEEEEDGPSPPKRIPAYQRFRHLVQKTPQELAELGQHVNRRLDLENLDAAELPGTVPVELLPAAVPTDSASTAPKPKPALPEFPVRLPRSNLSKASALPSRLAKPKGENQAIPLPHASTSTDARSTNLSSSSKALHDLPLPCKYKVLEELFHAMETVASLYYNRNEMITLNKIKPAVQEIMRRISFKERHLAQILTVYPESYNVTQECTKSSSSRISSCAPTQQQATYELVLDINLKSTSGIPEKLTSTVITERRRIFHENLLRTCHRYHEEFLSSLDPPVAIPAYKKVTQWHPEFRINEIPDINPTFRLPQPPETSKYNSARDVIAKAQNILDNANPKMKKALAELLKKKNVTNQPVLAVVGEARQEKDKSSSSAIATTASSTVLPSSSIPSKATADKTTNKTLSALKGVSQSLIDKIRAREQEKAIRAMTLTPEESKEKIMMSKLPAFVKSLRNTMITERRTALPLSLLVERLSHSHHGLSFGEVEDHIRLLVKLLPSWASILKLSQGEYLKINKETNINDLLEKFNEAIKKKY